MLAVFRGAREVEAKALWLASHAIIPPRLPALPAFDTAPVAFLALVGGATAMGISPVFVRFADVGPFTSAFWRVALALPALWLWSELERAGRAPARPTPAARLSVLFAGLLFAGDLSFWHLAIMNTSVANATFLATLAPGLGGARLRALSRRARGVARSSSDLPFACRRRGRPDRRHLVASSPGSSTAIIYGVATSFFFGAYFLAVRRARRVYGAGRTLFLSSIVTALVLLVEAVAHRGRDVAARAFRRRRALRARARQPCRRTGASLPSPSATFPRPSRRW